MDAAVAAIIGAGVGAIVPSVTQLYATAHENRRASLAAGEARQQRLEEAQELRDARLFDHRRVAYASFVQEARKYLGSIEEVIRMRQGDPPEDWLVPLWDRAADVALYGTPEADKRAQAANTALFNYAFMDGTYDTSELAITDFIEQARSDLGVAS